jgi:hypothetical protein
MRRGFGLIQVIFFMVLLSTILTITMRYASISAKQTGDLYLKEQAELFMQSAIEMAILGLEGHDKNSGCIHYVKIISHDKRFTADINLSNYFLLGSETCDRKSVIDTEASNGMVMMDIVVETNTTHPKNSQNLRLVRRTLQRI